MPSVRLLVSAVLLGSLSAQEMPRARLEGRTTDVMRAPVAMCAVTVEVDGVVIARTTSDASGCFVLGRLPQGRVVVRAVTAKDVGAAVVDLAGVDSSYATLTVYPARSVHGTAVVRSTDAPATPIWVMASPADDRGLGVIDACVPCRADGSYTLEHVLAGPVLVRVWAEGCDVFEAAIDGADDVQLDCALEPDAWRERVFALRAAAPAQLGGGQLVLTAQNHATGVPAPLPPPLRRMRPDAEGRCVVTGWSAKDRLQARFVSPGAAIDPPFDTAPSGPRRWTCTFDVVAHSDIHGVLRGPEGRALGGRLILCRPLDDDAAAMLRTYCRTAVDGTFRVPSPVGSGQRFALRVLDPELCVVDEASREAGSRSWYVGRRQEGQVHEVAVASAHTVRLCAVDAAGLAARGAVATMSPDGAQWADANGWPVLLGSAVGEAGGRIELGGIDLTGVTDVWVGVRSVGGVGEVRGVVASNRVIDLGNVTLAPARTCTGVVLDSAGKPMVGARVRLRLLRDPGSVQLTLSGRDGRFAYDGLMPGEYVLGAATNGEVRNFDRYLDLSQPVDEVVALRAR